MSEIINNSAKRKELLKHMILQLHAGEAPELVRKRLTEILRSIPYDEVVEVEQELINDGLPAEEVLQFCDIHTTVLDGHIDQSLARTIPPGHPVDTFKKENQEILKECRNAENLFSLAGTLKDSETTGYMHKLKIVFNNLSDIEKHYRRKENLLFPFLERYGITGPPKVMWGKHDETRFLMKTSLEAFSGESSLTAEDIGSIIEMVFKPALKAVEDMIMKEEEILFPMCMDKLTDMDWYSIYQQTIEIGYCLYDPVTEWTPDGGLLPAESEAEKGHIQLPTGSFSAEELTAIFSTIPVDLTFVDKNDKVKFFSLGPHRIFTRNRAIIGRDVRMCHPPSSVHVVEQILDDFKNNRQNSAAFWINMKGRFIYIEYFALRDKAGNYLGTAEFTQDLTDFRKLEGEQRLLSYSKN